MTNATKISVAIIGAGFAGLRAGDILSQNPSFDVTIFEARDRVGGRVAQDESLGFPLDMGANWIHDVNMTSDGKPNPITPIAERTGAELHEFSNYYTVFGDTGVALNTTYSDEAYNYLNKFLGEGLDFSNKSLDPDFESPINPSRSLGGFVRQSIQKDLRQHPRDKHKKVLSGLSLQLLEEENSGTGEEVDRRSLKYSAIEEGSEDDLFVASSYHDILNAVARPITFRNGVKLHLNSPVTRIQPHKSNSSGRVSIDVSYNSREDGRQTKPFDTTIVTIPIGVLRRKHQELMPSLPPRLSKSLSRLYAGRLEKVYIQFPCAFWDENIPEDERKSFYTWAAPAYANQTNPQRWIVEATSMSVFSEQDARPILLFYLAGNCSSHVVSLSAGKSKQEAHKALDDFFRPYYSKLPNFKPGIHDPTGFVPSQWSVDPYAGGSYVTFLAGKDQGSPQDVETIADGWPEMELYFAGEGTDVDGLGTTNGAYSSGETTARRIIKRWRPR